MKNIIELKQNEVSVVAGGLLAAIGTGIGTAVGGSLSAFLFGPLSIESKILTVDCQKLSIMQTVYGVSMASIFGYIGNRIGSFADKIIGF